jgi:hypothetical protein
MYNTRKVCFGDEREQMGSDEELNNRWPRGQFIPISTVIRRCKGI